VGVSVWQGEFTGNVGLTSSSSEKSQTDEKQWQDFGDRLRMLQIKFRCDSFSYGYVIGFSRLAHSLI
jgi:hypothetical protein